MKGNKKQHTEKEKNAAHTPGEECAYRYTIHHRLYKTVCELDTQLPLPAHNEKTYTHL